LQLGTSGPESPYQESKITYNQGIQVISRAASILRLLGKETQGLSLGKIATQVNLPRSTVQRIVAALSLEGFVVSGDGYGGIKLGPEILGLSKPPHGAFRDRIRPVMEAIAKETGETVDLAVLQDGRMLFIDQIVGSHRLRTVSKIGESFPLSTTANGKAALACLDRNRAMEFIKREGKKGDWLKKISSIQDRGLATDEDEHTEGISAIGFGLVDPSGEIFALSVPVPSSRYKRIKGKLITVLLKAKKTFQSTQR
jgi:DNA-binding IclR family transcriptional regulator